VSSRTRIFADRDVVYGERPAFDPNGLRLTEPLPTDEAGTFLPSAPAIPPEGYFALSCPGCSHAGTPHAPLTTQDAKQVRWDAAFTEATFVGIRCPTCGLSWTVTAARTTVPLPG